MLNSYFVELHTGASYSPDDYDAAAGRLMQLCVSILSNPDTVTMLTHDAARESCHSEIEVSLEPSNGLVCKAVVDIVAASPVKFDKSKLTKMIKLRPEYAEWPGMKVYKKMIPNVPDSFRAELIPQ